MILLFEIILILKHTCTKNFKNYKIYALKIKKSFNLQISENMVLKYT